MMSLFITGFILIGLSVFIRKMTALD